MIFESHAHYDDRQFDPDREALLEMLPQQGIGCVVNIGSCIETTKSSLKLARQYPYIYAAVGVHPSDAAELNEVNFAWLKTQALTANKVAAIGEIGLDYYWDKEAKVRENQKKWFIRQLELAKEAQLPVVIHSRDAAADTLDIIREHHHGETGGVIHCFSYSKEIAREYLNMGYYIGVGGVVTFNNAKALKDVVADTPLERILLETDCPYLAPVPHRGRRNSSEYLPLVVQAIAEIKGVTEQAVEEETWNNASRMYQL